jgi:hypothetical protein
VINYHFERVLESIESSKQELGSVFFVSTTP